MSGLVVIGAAKFLPLLARLSVVAVVMYFVTSGLLKKWRRQRKMTSEYEEESRDLKEG